MRNRGWVAVLGTMFVCGGACTGSVAGTDVLAGDLPVRVDHGGDAGGAPDAVVADTVPVDPGTAPAVDAAADLVDVADVAPDPGVADDPGADPDPGVVDTFVPCFLGQVECFGGAAGSDGKTCATASVVGRWRASRDGTLANPSNETTGNGSDLPASAGSKCQDSGNDLYYRVYLKPGETFSLLLAYHPSIDMMAKIFRGTDCSDASLVKCLDDDLDGPIVGSDPPVDTEAEMDSFQPDVEGWYTIVFDGRTSDDIGKSMVQFHLFNCGDVDCCCQ